mgnify:CR=1 FL=1
MNDRGDRHSLLGGIIKQVEGAVFRDNVVKVPRQTRHAGHGQERGMVDHIGDTLDFDVTGALVQVRS